MFLHSGASLHGHEYSHIAKPPSHPQPPALRRNSLLRSALSSSSTSAAAAAAAAAHTTTTSSSPSSSSSILPSASPSALPSTSLTSPSTFLSSTPTAPPPSTTTSTTTSKRHSFSSAFSFSPFAPTTVSDGLRPARSSTPNNSRHRTASLSGGITAALTRPALRPIEHPVVRFHDPVVVDTPCVKRAHSASTPAPSPYGPRLRQLTDQATMLNEDAASVSASEASFMSDQPPSSAASSKPGNHHHHNGSSHNHGRTSRKSTTYLFAHPAPKLSRKKPLLNRIRPTLLMQLQKISLDARPLPVIDVYPSSLLVGNVTAPRFSKRFPRLFGINGELGLHDTILVHSDNYGRSSVSSESEDEDSFEHRTLMAVFSPLRGGDHSEIVLEDGTVWITTTLPNGSFEFTRIDEHGNSTTARWVRRLTTKRAQASVLDDSHSALSAAEPECKFIFSVIDPQSRRHPILASLTKVTLSILDRYTTVSPASNGRYPPSRSWAKSTTSHDTDTSNDELSQDEDGGADVNASVNPNPSANANANRSQMAVSMLPDSKGRATLPVDEKLKNFITISSVWVSLQCGWGQSQTGMPGPAGLTNSTAGSLRKIRDRQLSEPVTVSESANGDNVRGRRLSARYSRRSATFMPLEATADQERDASPSVAGRSMTRTAPLPRKASSTGAAYVQRQKQLQQVSDTSDSERPGPGMSSLTPRRRSRAFSRLSGEFTSMVSSKMHQSPSPPHCPATPEEPAPTTVSRSNSLRLPTAPSEFKPSRNGRGTVSAYYTSKPVLEVPETRAAVDHRASSYTPATSTLGTEPLGVPWEHQQQLPPQQQSPLRQRTGQDLDRHGGKWRKMGSWLKSRLSSH